MRPAPTTATCWCSRLTSSSRPRAWPTFSWASSTAAEEIDTAPVPRLVSVRTRLPVLTAWLSRRFRIGPTERYSWPRRTIFFTWERI